MGKNKKIQGYCHICGEYGELTFEHVPPRSAYNNRSLLAYDFDQSVNLGPDDNVKGKITQKGMGDYTLCGRCNNNTGQWYGSKFKLFCEQGMEILLRAKGDPVLIYKTVNYPLEVLKQIVAMFFSVNGDGLAASNPDLARFVLNKKLRYIPPKFRFFLYYNLGKKYRYIKLMSKHDASGKNDIIWMSEISFPPYGYMMTIDSKKPDPRLVEITHFSKYDYGEFAVLRQKLPVLPTNYFIPGDYRTEDEMREDIKKNEKYRKDNLKNNGGE